MEWKERQEKMALIINADDFGRTEEVNQAISECFQLQYIDRTTLMVNMPYADMAIKQAGEMGFIEQVGLHLNLTAGCPLTEKIRQNPLFCDAEGIFHAGFHKSLKTRLMMSAADVVQITEELDAQIQKYLEYGCVLKHVDSHHHVHTDLPVLKALEPLLSKYGMRSIRIGRNLFTTGSLFNVVYKYYYNTRLNKTGLEQSDYFGSANDFRSYIRDRRLEAEPFLKRYQVEIMTHPMYDADGMLVDTCDPMNAEWCASLCRQEKEN